MQKINYRFTFVFIYISFILFSLLLLKYVFEKNTLTNIDEISKINIEKTFQEKESYINDFLQNYKNSLIALSENKTVNNYINNNKNSKEELQSIFITTKKSLPSFNKIKIINLVNNKLKNDYFQFDFNSTNKLNKGEVYISKIHLSKSNNIKNKEPIITIATPLFNTKNIKHSLLLANISLQKLFNNLRKSSIYHIMLIDNKKRFILHYDNKKGLTSSSYDSYQLNDEFKKHEAINIISNRHYTSDVFYSAIINNLNTQQEIRMVLKPKFQKLIQENKENQHNVYFLIILISFIFLPIVFYFARIPEILKDKIYEQTVTDQLTNLPNKQHLLKDLNQHKFLNAAIILVNIDNFDKIQTAYGYKIAENLIIEISKYLDNYTNTHRNFIKLYKVSKNIFALKFEVISKNNFINIIENFHRDMENKLFEPFKGFEILANCTVASSDPVNLNNDLNELKEAELALSSALDSSKEINIYDNDDFNKIEKNKKNIDMVNKIKKAIDTNNVIVQFQPIYNNYQEKIDKYETLIRLKTSDGNIIYPGEFLVIAKDIKKYKELTKIVIEKSFEYFKDKDYEFSINLSIEDISSKEIRDFLFKKINEYNINKKLVLEIVESEAIENYDDFINFIKSVKKLGCKIAIDDFGSGYSNYSYIVKLSEHIDYLKIDGSLVLGLHEDPKKQLLIGTVKFLCDNLNIQTIAEFIESKELFEYIKSMGINYSQGFYIGKPKDKI